MGNEQGSLKGGADIRPSATFKEIVDGLYESDESSVEDDPASARLQPLASSRGSSKQNRTPGGGTPLDGTNSRIRSSRTSEEKRPSNQSVVVGSLSGTNDKNSLNLIGEGNNYNRSIKFDTEGGRSESPGAVDPRDASLSTFSGYRSSSGEILRNSADCEQ